MKKLIFTAVLLTLSAVPATAETPSDESINELIELTDPRGGHIVTLCQQIWKTYYLVQLQSQAKKRLSEEEQDRLEQARKKDFDISKWHIPREEIRRIVARRYRDHLTQAEVNQVVELLKSPAWKIYTETFLPLNNKDTASIMQFASQFYPRIDLVVEDELKQLRLSGKENAL